MQLVTIEKLGKNYGEQVALHDFNASIKKGEIIGLLGQNGAGKSTLIKLITGVIPPTTGNVFFDGISIMESPIEIKMKLGYLPEQNPLYQDMYVKEYLSFITSVFKVSKNRMQECIELTGLGKESHKKIHELSKGYKQRVGLAKALLNDPELLILDEPTTGLDPIQIIEIRKLIQSIAKDKTVILSTHLMQEVEAICTRALVLKSGELIADLDKDSFGDMESTFKELMI